MSGPIDPGGITRRGFLRGAALAAGGLSWQASAQAAPDGLREVRHVVIDDGPQTCCGQARQCGLKVFPGGELAVLYRRAARDGALARGDVVLRRSSDNGLTWPSKNDVILWSGQRPRDEHEAFLCQDPAARQVLDMSRPEAMFFFGQSSIRLTRTVKDTKEGWTTQWRTSGEGSEPCTVFQLRSTDKGRSWEKAPLVLDRPPRIASFWKDNHPLVTMPDGALVGALESNGAVWLYGSECQGMTWQLLAQIAAETPERGRPCSPGLILLPNARLQCYLLMVQGSSRTLCLSQSDDGFRWSEPRPLVAHVHSPWPLRLRDGRTVVVFARQKPPAGIAAIASPDDGRSWPLAAIIRDGPAGPRFGDPAAAEPAPGRIFTAYSWQRPEKEATLLAGSFFQLG